LPGTVGNQGRDEALPWLALRRTFGREQIGLRLGWPRRRFRRPWLAETVELERRLFSWLLKWNFLGLDRHVEISFRCDADLREALDFNSMDIFNLVVALSPRFEIEIPDADAARLVTLGGGTDYLERRLSGS
jgi:acyl carrier protein